MIDRRLFTTFDWKALFLISVITAVGILNIYSASASYRVVGMPYALKQFYWAVIVTKEHLYEFLLREGVTETPLDLHGGFELVRLIEQFFERAILYVAAEYEQAGALEGKAEYRAVHA